MALEYFTLLSYDFADAGVELICHFCSTCFTLSFISGSVL